MAAGRLAAGAFADNGGTGTGVGGTVRTAGLSTASPAPFAAPPLDADAPWATGAVAIFDKSPMFFDNSATRAALSFACLSFAKASSWAALPASAPLDSVSLSGATAAAARSSTFAWTFPVASRFALSTCFIGAPDASFCLNELKSLACATMVLEASTGLVVPASSAVGMSSTLPDRKRLIFPPIKASGLLFSNATSIWSSEILAGLFLAAILLAVSPALTVTFWSAASALGAVFAFSFAMGIRLTGMSRPACGWRAL